jgi:hypothetical protein
MKRGGELETHRPNLTTPLPSLFFLFLFRHTHRPDEELCISYGEDKDNHRLLVTYGFVDRTNPNGVRLAIPTEEEEEEEEADSDNPPSYRSPSPQQRALLQRLGVVGAERPSLVVGRGGDGLPRALAARLVLAAPSIAAAAVGGRTESDLIHAIFAAAPPAERARVLDVAARALDAGLRAYGTSLEEDLVGLGEEGGAKGGGLQVSALLLRIEEKRALREAVDWVRGKRGGM